MQKRHRGHLGPFVVHCVFAVPLLASCQYTVGLIPSERDLAPSSGPGVIDKTGQLARHEPTDFIGRSSSTNYPFLLPFV